MTVRPCACVQVEGWLVAMGSLHLDESKRLEWLKLGDISDSTIHRASDIRTPVFFPSYASFSLVSSPSSPDKQFPSFISQANSPVFPLDFIILRLYLWFCLLIIIFLLSIFSISLFTGPLLGLVLLS